MSPLLENAGAPDIEGMEKAGDVAGLIEALNNKEYHEKLVQMRQQF